MTFRRRRIPAALALLSSLAMVGTAAATPAVTATRFAGDDRYGTAQAIATQTFTNSTVAILTSGQNFPDALVAAYLAGAVRSPVLLTPTDALPAATASALQSLNVAGVIIVGGPEAVSTAVETDVRGRGYQVDRIHGVDRYETSRRVAEAQSADGIGSLGTGGRTAIVTSGQNFPDALASVPLSTDAAFPLLITPPDNLSAHTSGALDTLAIKQVLLLGGAEALSAGVEQAIAAKGITVRRISGTTRTQTAAAIADLAVNELAFANTHANLARGDDFADALAGGPHAGRERAVILLTENANTLGAATQAWLQARAATITQIHVFGGPVAISDATVAAARQAAGGT